MFFLVSIFQPFSVSVLKKAPERKKAAKNTKYKIFRVSIIPFPKLSKCHVKLINFAMNVRSGMELKYKIKEWINAVIERMVI